MTSSNLRFDTLWADHPENWQFLPHLPSPKQRKFLEYECTEGLFGGAAGGGKSDALLMAALQGITEPSYAAILFRRTFQDLSLSGALMDRAHEWWGPTDAHWRAETKTFVFPTGARISFGYLDSARDHQRYQSAEYQFVGFDEASQFEERPSTYLLSRLRAPLSFPEWLPLRWRGATNPGGIGHAWLQKRYAIPEKPTARIIELRKSGQLERVFVPSLACDNPGLNVSEYLQKLQKLDPVTRAQLERGEWIVDSSGLVYYCYNSGCNVSGLPKDIPAKDWRRVLAQDYASTTDKTAFAVLCYCDYLPTVYLEYTEEHSGMSPSDAARRTDELTERFGGFVAMVGDSGGLGAAYVLEMQKHWALPIVAAEKQHKAAYIRLLNGELANGRFKIVAHQCESWIRQAKVLLWKNSDHLIENQSQPNDSTDAGLYGWRECRHYATSEKPSEPEARDEYEQAALDRVHKNNWDSMGSGLGVW